MTETSADIEPTEAVIELFHARTGIVYPPARRMDALAGIHRAMALEGCPDETRFLERIRTNTRAFSRLVEQLTVAETYFFREIAQFDEIRSRIIPELRAARGVDWTLRAWSAGCSSGEEAYSLAILFEQEHMPARVLATDISSKALAKTRHGVYGSWSLRGEGHRAATYIDSDGPRLTMPDRLRDRIDIRELNLISDDYPSVAAGTTELDLILCRNVLIYFDERNIRKVAERLRTCLANGGWLITGPSDPPLWDYTDLEAVTTSAGIFYRRSAHPRRLAANRLSERPPAVAERPIERRERPSRQRIRTRSARPLPQRRVEPTITVAHIRGLADRGDLANAVSASESAIAMDPTVPEFHYLRAIALLALDRNEEAFEELRRVIYLDRSLAIAHFAMGTLLTGRGELAKARRAFQRAYVLCTANNPDEILPLTDGERAEGLAEAALAHIEMLNRNNRLNEGPRVS